MQNETAAVPKDDGALDILTANSISDDIAVLLGAGDGSFGSASFFAAGDGCGASAACGAAAPRHP